ncbi:MAG TPA: RNA polymerase sigma factor [Phycisphaerales bacterium]|nr:RNA polymerase sigma factor [Phycisphaerales bacterium]
MTTLSPALQRLAPLSDEELVASILAGSGPAFELLMRRHNARLFRIARAVVTDDSEAEEIVQETYVRAYAGLAGFQGRASLATWLSRIAFHEALRARRRIRRARATDPAQMDHAHSSPSHESDDQRSRAAHTEARAVLTAAIDALPDGLRAVVMLRLVQGLSTRETAECLRLSESNVKVSLHRARRMLAESIERRAVSELREQFAFAGERCDRVVAGVFSRLEARRGSPGSSCARDLGS